MLCSEPAELKPRAICLNCLLASGGGLLGVPSWLTTSGCSLVASGSVSLSVWEAGSRKLEVAASKVFNENGDLQSFT